MKLILLLALISTSAFAAKPDIEIKSGTNGTTYCTPMDSPACKSHRAVEMQRLNERRDYEQRLNERRDYEQRQRELDRREDQMRREWERESDRRYGR